MWKICLVALAAGAGVVVLFGFLLLGLKFAQGPAKRATHDAATGATDDDAAAHSTGTDRPPAREHGSVVSRWRSCAAWFASG